MKRDPFVLGDGCILPGDDVGKTRPNANVLIVGATGCGKSTSVFLPTVSRMLWSNPVLSFAKPQDGYSYAKYLAKKGYQVHIMDLTAPCKSTISYDPVLSLESVQDIESLSKAIMDSVITKTVDDYWQRKACPLISAVIAAPLMLSEEGSSPGMIDALELFNRTIPREDGCTVSAEADQVFRKLEKADPNCFAVREYSNWHSLPYKTASCVRDTAAAVLSAVFPEAIRKMMQRRPQLDLEHFVRHKEAVIVITSALEPTQQLYANLFYRDIERQLLRYAARCPKGELPREVRFFFEDFACTAKISGFATDISLFRSAGISAAMFLQSEQQLDAIYQDEAPIIRQNCAAYVYFPGGFDDRSCEIVSKRMGLPYEEVLYAPMGKVFVMRSGCQPIHIPRYDTLHSKEYRDFLKIIESDVRTSEL